MVEIERVRHDWPEAEGFTIHRPNGYPRYTFLHFQTPVELQVGGQRISARPGACIYFGFKDQITPEEFSAAVDANLADPESMTGLVNRIEVKPGDVFLVAAGVFHRASDHSR